MPTERQERVSELVRKLANEHLARESNRNSLITITRVTISPDLKNATVFYTVLPDSAKSAAEGFMLRQRKHIRNHIKKNANLRAIPHIEIMFDEGEKNRQRIDELSIGTRLENDTD
jgi:ribosome-binding factor A